MMGHKTQISRGLIRLMMLVLLLGIATLPCFAVDWDGALKAIQEGMATEQAEIDLTPYALPEEGFWERYNAWVEEGKFPWYVVSGGNGWIKDGMETSVSPNYLDPEIYDRQLYEDRVAQILAQTVHEGMSGWQIALSIHDYLITICEYDHRWETDRDNANYRGYDLIVNGLAVCEGYSEAYMDLMNRVGIPCIKVRSTGEGKMAHSWNLVYLRENWYHVDVTWDDPSFNNIYDIQGYVGHDYFLLSDAAISDEEHKHFGWESPYACTDTSYEYAAEPFWKDVYSQIIWLDDSVSFWRDGDYQAFAIKRRDSDTGISTKLWETEPASVDVGAGKYFYWTYGLNYWNGLLYFADTVHVYTLPLNGGEPNVLYTLDPAVGYYINGCYVNDEGIHLTLSTHDGLREKVTVSNAVGDHSHSYTTTDYAPTCQAEGYTLFTCSCGDQFTSGQKEMVDHDYSVSEITTPATCVSEGVVTYSCVYGCGSSVTEGIPATGVHTYQETERVEATTLNGGYVVETCSVCGDTKTEKFPQLPNPFRDVAAGEYYEIPVLWAVAKKITTGTSDTAFSPDQPCTRGQVVTFLWRSAGSPEPDSGKNPFSDVKKGEYYYNAVLWAVEQGITTGTSETAFSPGQPCTRGQVATFLHRAEGTPEAVSGKNPFTDVAAGQYYEKAVVWAVENSITSGVGDGKFAPNGTCTRAQIVTFLWRASEN